MASLVVQAPSGASRVVRLVRKLTTIGASPACDVSIQDAGLEELHAQVRAEDGRYVVVGMLRDMTINGRRAKEGPLADGDIIRLGQVELRFNAKEPDRAPSPAVHTIDALNAYRKLHDFSTALMSNASTEVLVSTLLDGVVELTGAQRGFLLLMDEGRAVVRAQRNLGETAYDSNAALSDSIVQRVIESKEPLLVHDALHHEEWSASQSVVQLGLQSVLCLPLLDDASLQGLLYLGNNARSQAFDRHAFEIAQVFAAQASLLLGQRRRFEALSHAKQALEAEAKGRLFGEIIGACDSMKNVFKRIRKVSGTDITVLITGETGTGKELVAREIHRNSNRAQGPFIVINCGAIPEALLESELFGHTKGAFTGAIQDRQGRFQVADGGTLFLDEIGEMPLPLQVKLLRVLQERVVTPVGDSHDHPVDIRVLTATHRDLETEVKEGRFREDLYYRLNVVNVHVPPLRERGLDIDLLAQYFLDQCKKDSGKHVRGFTQRARAALLKYAWKGNVRELENRVRKAHVLSDGPSITEEDLDLREEDLQPVMTLAEAKAQFQQRYIREVLERNAGNRTRAAKELGVDPRTVFRYLEQGGTEPS